MNLFKEATGIVHSNYYAANKFYIRFINIKNPDGNINVVNILNSHPEIIKNIQLPDFTNQMIESYSSNRWHIAVGKQDPFQINFTFYSVHKIASEEIDIYTKMLAQWELQKIEYPDSLTFSIIIAPKTRDGSIGKSIQFDNCLIQSISGSTLDNTIQNEISEFSANIIAPKLKINDKI